jgi:acyl-CoA hydrolase
VVDRAERIHDPGRLKEAPPLFAVNGALEIDIEGQVNIESTGGSAIGSIGGQPDYLAGGSASSGGLSIIALTTTFAGRPTLVGRLSAPASSPAHDVDMVVTETGVADLRGAGRAERPRRLRQLWNVLVRTKPGRPPCPHQPRWSTASITPW